MVRCEGACAPTRMEDRIVSETSQTVESQAPSTGHARALWSVAEFALNHGISTRQVYALLGRAQLDGVRVGRRTLITDESRLSWLASLPRFVSGTPIHAGPHGRE
jgi:hypothetical protein